MLTGNGKERSWGMAMIKLQYCAHQRIRMYPSPTTNAVATPLGAVRRRSRTCMGRACYFEIGSWRRSFGDLGDHSANVG